MPAKFYLQRADNGQVWEEVDEYLFRNWSKALCEKGEERYSGNFVRQDEEGKLHLSLEDAAGADLAIVARFLGVRLDHCPQAIPGGFLRTPEFVKVTPRPNSIMLHEMSSGKNFKMAA